MVLCNIIILQPISSHIKNLIIRIRIDRKLYLLKMQGHFKGMTRMTWTYRMMIENVTFFQVHVMVGYLPLKKRLDTS